MPRFLNFVCCDDYIGTLNGTVTLVVPQPITKLPLLASSKVIEKASKDFMSWLTLPITLATSALSS